LSHDVPEILWPNLLMTNHFLVYEYFAANPIKILLTDKEHYAQDRVYE